MKKLLLVLLLLFVGLILFAVIIDFQDTDGTATPTLSAVEQYGEAIRNDSQLRANEWSESAKTHGSPDFSGKGYKACLVSSDCLSGEQTCQAGIVPNTLPEPGYCVPGPSGPMDSQTVDNLVENFGDPQEEILCLRAVEYAALDGEPGHLNEDGSIDGYIVTGDYMVDPVHGISTPICSPVE